jgi:hypothetical protein
MFPWPFSQNIRGLCSFIVMPVCRNEYAKMDPSTGQLTDTLCAVDKALRHFPSDLLGKAIGAFVDYYCPRSDCTWLEENFIAPEILEISIGQNNKTK